MKKNKNIIHYKEISGWGYLRVVGLYGCAAGYGQYPRLTGFYRPQVFAPSPSLHFSVHFVFLACIAAGPRTCLNPFKASAMQAMTLSSLDVLFYSYFVDSCNSSYSS